MPAHPFWLTQPRSHSHEVLQTSMRASHDATWACTVRDIKQVLECTYVYYLACFAASSQITLTNSRHNQLTLSEHYASLSSYPHVALALRPMLHCRYSLQQDETPARSKQDVRNRDDFPNASPNFPSLAACLHWIFCCTATRPTANRYDKSGLSAGCHKHWSLIS